MRRIAYPYGRYLIRQLKIEFVGPKLKEFVESLGFPVVRYETRNEKNGTLIIAVNKKIKEFMKQKKPPGHVELVLRGFLIDPPPLREMSIESQRIGIELYLWPVEEGTLLEIFVLPYLEHLNKREIYGITQSRKEEITDWSLCEQIWAFVVPKIEAEFDAEPLHQRR